LAQAVQAVRQELLLLLELVVLLVEQVFLGLIYRLLAVVVVQVGQ
jgi:hypothetical protein